MKEIDVNSPGNSERRAVSMHHLFSRSDRRKRKVAKFTNFSQAPLYRFSELDNLDFKCGFTPDDKDKYGHPKAILVKDDVIGKYFIMDVSGRKELEEGSKSDSCRFLARILTEPNKYGFALLVRVGRI